MSADANFEQREDDPSIELLVPEGGALERRAREAAALVQALGADEEQGCDLDCGDALFTFEQENQVRACGAIEDLLVHHLQVVLGGRSFLHLPVARVGVQAAWEMLLHLQSGSPQLPGVPGPGEGPLAVAARLLEGLHALGWDDDLLQLWRARIERAGGGQRAGESAFRKRLDGKPAAGAGSRTYPEWLMGLVECVLDRGAVREARELLNEDLQFTSRSESLRLNRLRAWIALLMGGPPPQASVPTQAVWEMQIPRALVQMRMDWPAASGALAGREMQGFPARNAWNGTNAALQISRGDLGAVVYCVFAVRAEGGVERVHVDVAPGLRAHVDRWSAGREDACCTRKTPEHGLLVGASSVRSHDFPRGSTLSKRTLAMALTPVLDEMGELAGWVHFEWEHHLIPDRDCLTAIAESWKLCVWRRAMKPRKPALALVDRVSEQNEGGWAGAGAGARLQHGEPAVTRDLCAPVFESCVRALGLKLSQRRWWGFVQGDGDTFFVASGGDGLDDALAHSGGARGIDRCLASSGVVRFDEPSPNLSIHAGSASGVVLPFLHCGRIVALLVIESSRRRDFQSTCIEHLTGITDGFALSLVLARFRSWHLERFGADLYFDGASDSLHELSGQVEAASRAQSPVVFSGPSGTGKHTLSRWLHWSRGRSGEDLHRLHGRLDFPAGTTPAQFAKRLLQPHGSVVLDGLAQLEPALQGELLCQLEQRDVRRTGARSKELSLRERLIVKVNEPLASIVQRGQLLAPLAARLERMQIFVAPLVDRRREIPGLVRFLAERLSAEQGCRAPIFLDEALALLWRQSWKDNLRGLEALIFKLVLLYPGAEVGSEAMRDVARRFKFPLLAKLPSKRPRRRDLLQVLHTTMKNTGRFNKRRAALYMGWDPDTLVLRLADSKIDEGTLTRDLNC